MGGRRQQSLVDGVARQVDAVAAAVAEFADTAGAASPRVRGALAFVDAEFGLFASPFSTDDVWIG